MNKRHAFTVTLISLLVASLVYAAEPITSRSDGTVARYLDTNQTVVRVVDGSDETIICNPELLSAAENAGLATGDNCLRFSLNDGGGDIPVNVGSGAGFTSFLVGFERNPDADYCEVVRNPWTAWTSDGSIPSECGVHTYDLVRVCSEASYACADTCPGTSSSYTDRQSTSIDNGTCNGAPIASLELNPSSLTIGESADARLTMNDPDGDSLLWRASTVEGCFFDSDSGGSFQSFPWTPLGEGFFIGPSYRNISDQEVALSISSDEVGDCNVLYQVSDGVETIDASISFPVTACVPTEWLPSEDSVTDGQAFTQTSDCGTTQAAIGEMPISHCEYSSDKFISYFSSTNFYSISARHPPTNGTGDVSGSLEVPEYADWPTRIVRSMFLARTIANVQANNGYHFTAGNHVRSRRTSRGTTSFFEICRWHDNQPAPG